jgi:Domain of unknown function (DUF5666)
MKTLVLKSLILASIAGLLLISCDGGSSDWAGGGIDGTGVISAGVVSAFGSIVVNGTEFDTTKAEVVINGVRVGVGDEFVEDNLKIGMVVTVEGRVMEDESGVADRVIYSSNVVGPVESVGVTDPVTNEKEIVVLGQTVIVNFITEFRPADIYGFDLIAPDDVVIVSGYRDFDGNIRATYIENITDPGVIVYEVTGLVKNLDDPTPNTFVINGLTIDYSSILPEDLPDNFANGLFVEVEGELADISGNLVADEIRFADVVVGEEVEEIEIMGYVTEVLSENGIIKFRIGNQEVHADKDRDVVEYVDGDPANIVPGQRLEAEGSLEGGILTAWEIEFWKPDQIEVEGVVARVDFIGGFPEFTFAERADQLFQTNGDTEFENIERGEIEVGMRLEVKGVPNEIDHSIIAADKVSLEVD